ncbi:MAG: hypothetical protein ABIQ55_01385, partial [Gemmatimonadaceae bacterium]
GVKFSEWTSDGSLRQPIYLGTRDDKKATEVGREGSSMQKKNSLLDSPKKRTSTGLVGKSSARRRIYAQRTIIDDDGDTKKATKKGTRTTTKTVKPASGVVAHLTEIQNSSGSGKLDVDNGVSMDVTNLGKVFFPKKKLTKGGLMRYYAAVAPYVLPAMADRPLVLKRFPNGVTGPSFFQQNAGEPPDFVRTEMIHTEGGSTNLRIVGGDLATLLYTVQLGSVSVDPWHSRVQSLDHADYSIIDLDPGPRAPFSRVREVAKWALEVMEDLGLRGALKTSGSTGMHIYMPLPSNTTNEAATLVAQIIAARVSQEHPKEATIERSVKARGAAMVYVDYLQNIIGKTVAAAYSARANPEALVSTPLEWSELGDDLDPRDFTIETAPERFAEKGDIWAAQLKKKNSLRALV